MSYGTQGLYEGATGDHQTTLFSAELFFFFLSYLFPFSAELVSELGDSEGEVEYRGLRIHSQPRGGAGGEGGPGVGGGGVPIRTRVRHNSDGNYDDVSLMQETILREREEEGKEEEREVGEDRVYQNLAFHR